MSAQIKTYMPDQLVSRISGPVVLLADHLTAMAAASARSDKLAELLREALHEMCSTVAPRNSFTGTIDRIDAALSGQPACAKARAKAAGCL